MDRSKAKIEKEVLQKCDHLHVEVDKLNKSVTELEEYSELDCMPQVWLIV